MTTTALGYLRVATTALGYLRVSTEEQARSGLGLEAQRAAVQLEADRRGWDLEVLVDDGYSAKDLRRPAITTALQQLAAGDAQVLVVAKLDRLSRSLVDFAGVLELAKKQGWAVVALDLGIDMTTAVGELVASVMAAVAQWERRAIGERTAAALQAKKAGGARLGAPVLLQNEVRGRIQREKAAGLTLTAIAGALNDEGVPTARGGAKWHPSTIRAVLRSIDHDVQAARHTP